MILHINDKNYKKWKKLKWNKVSSHAMHFFCAIENILILDNLLLLMQITL